MRSLYAWVVLALLAAGCDDPTGVGVELIDSRAGAPEIVETSPTLDPGTTVFDVTGGARRTVFGSVVDPLIGGTEAAGALDFALPANFVPSADYRTGPVEEAELRLVRDYRYGDTTATMELSVSEIFEDWSATGGTSSTAITPGVRLTSASFSASDTLITVPLPESWVDDKDADLRSQDFVSLFNGFLLEPLTDGAIVGIDVDESRMRVISGGDTVDFPVSRNLSLISRTAPGSPPAGHVVLQDGPGSGLGLNLAVDGEPGEVAVSRVVVRIAYDSVAFNQGLPPNFVRPAMQRVDLVGITADSISVPLATSQVRDGVLIFDDPVLRSTLQNFLLDQSVFESFALMGTLDLAPVENTVSALLLKDSSSGADAPTMALTVIRATSP